MPRHKRIRGLASYAPNKLLGGKTSRCSLTPGRVGSHVAAYRRRTAAIACSRDSATSAENRDAGVRVSLDAQYVLFGGRVTLLAEAWRLGCEASSESSRVATATCAGLRSRGHCIYGQRHARGLWPFVQSACGRRSATVCQVSVAAAAARLTLRLLSS